jgi:uncharacterized protein with PIN domain
MDNGLFKPMDAQATPSAAIALQRCPACRDKVVVERDNEIVVHNAILRVDRASSRVTAKCRRCKAWVEVPLKFVG